MGSGKTKASRVRPAAIGAAAMGVITASIGIVAPPAYADNYPSWNDVQQAKQNVQQQQAMIANITTLITGLQTAVDSANQAAGKAAEVYLAAESELQAATTKSADLQQQADAALANAKTSQMRAGLLASHLAKSVGQDPSIDLLLEGGNGSAADRLLYQLGTMSKLTAQSQEIYAQAMTDKNAAQALTDQATVAKQARAKLADAATRALAAAKAAASTAQAALATQQSKSTELISQLATLKNTSAAVEASYLQGEQVRQAAAAAAAAAAAQAAADLKAKQDAAAAAAAAAKNSGSSGGSGSSGSGSSAGNSSSAGSSWGPIGSSAPNSSQVERAISFAMAQLGKPYSLGGAGPNVWDCSGLTMMSYAAAGISIGQHYVSSQYYTMQSRGRLFPYSQRQRGDLLFWYNGGFYHNAIYLGNGQMIAAATYGEPVKIQPVWGVGGDLMNVVGRPSG